MKTYSFFVLLFIPFVTFSVEAKSISKPQINNSVDEVNVKMFGAKGDGITNDYGAISAAISFASKSVNQKTVRIHQGTYLTDKSIHIPTGITIIGDGIDNTIIKASAPLYGLIAIKPIGGNIKVNSVVIKGITVNSDTKPASCCIQVFYAQNITIDNVKCLNSINENMVIQQGTENVFVRNSQFNGGSFCLQVYGVDNSNKTPQLSKDYPHNIYIQKNSFINTANGSVFVNGAKHIEIKENTMTGGLRGVGIGVPYTLVSGSINGLKGDKWATENILIEANSIYNTDAFGIQTFYGRNMIIKGNTVKGVKGLSGDKSCLTIDRTIEVTASDNTLIGTDGTLMGAFITGAKKVSFLNNNISTARYGIQIAANWESGEDTAINESENIVVSNNVINNIFDCGIITNGAVNVSLLGNTVHKSTFGIYFMGSARTRDGKMMYTKNITATGNVLTDSVITSIYVGSNVVDDKIITNNNQVNN